MSLIGDPFVLVLLFGYVFLYISLYYFVIRRKRERITERKQKFFEALTEGLKTGSLTTIDDIVNIYKGVAGLGSEDLDYRYGLSKQLREFLVEVISKKVDKSLGNEQIVDWKQKITAFIKKNEEISPYSDLPAAERNILSDISTFLEKNDPESIKRKTLELAAMIQARNDDFTRVRNINKWTLPLSIIGLILTITFGILVLAR